MMREKEERKVGMWMKKEGEGKGERGKGREIRMENGKGDQKKGRHHYISRMLLGVM